jgi:Bacterial Ig-like domain (group 3)
MRRLVLTGLMAALIGGVAATAAMAETASTETRTTLTPETNSVGGRNVTVYAATVEGVDGKPVTGAVSLVEGNRAIAGAALDSTGKAAIRFDSLSSSDHSLHAVYQGDASHASSQSNGITVRGEAGTAPAFALGIAVVGSTNPATMTIATPGLTGNLVATVTPSGGFTGFISLSCSGPAASTGAPGGSSLPVGVSCVFTPLNLQVTSATPENADMSLQTTLGENNVSRDSVSDDKGKHLALAILLPGVLGLGFLTRKRKLLQRTALLLLVGIVGVIGTSGCSARYKYLHHGPTTEGTSPGTYTMTITAQTSNGVTAFSQSQTLTLIVQ